MSWRAFAMDNGWNGDPPIQYESGDTITFEGGKGLNLCISPPESLIQASFHPKPGEANFMAVAAGQVKMFPRADIEMDSEGRFVLHCIGCSASDNGVCEPHRTGGFSKGFSSARAERFEELDKLLMDVDSSWIGRLYLVGFELEPEAWNKRAMKKKNLHPLA